MSKMIDEVITTVAIMKDKILARLDAGQEVSMDGVDVFCREAFKECAQKMGGRRESTIRASCTREIGYPGVRDFYDAVRDMIRDPNAGRLTGRLCSRMRDEDNERDIERRMEAIFPPR